MAVALLMTIGRTFIISKSSSGCTLTNPFSRLYYWPTFPPTDSREEPMFNNRVQLHWRQTAVLA